MKAYLYRILKIEEGEGGRVAILLIMSFFMGVFLATISVASQSQFLLTKDASEKLPYALLISGAFGFVATVLYNFFQNRIPFQLLATISLLVIAGVTAILEFGEYLFSNQEDVYFYGFTMILPFTFLTYLVFWGSFGRLFNLRQAKRLVGSVDLGAMLASFLAYFSILILVTNTDHETLYALYTISLVSILCFIGFTLALFFRFLNRTRSFAEEKKLYKKLEITDFVKNRYIMYMSIFVVVSFIAINFVDYSFLSVTNIQYKGKIAELTTFITSFEAAIVVFGFLFENFATDRIIEEYGMRVAMIINPILIGVFTVAALSIGLAFGYEGASSSFVIFFLVISVSKLFVRALKDSLDNPTFKLYLLPIEASIRIDVQTKIEGLVTAFAMAVAAGFIILIKVNNLDLIYISIFALPLFAIWYFVANKMNTSYKHTLQDTLSKNKEKSKKRLEKEYTVFKVLEKEIKSSVEEKVIYGLKLMEKLEPTLFENAIISLSESENRKIKAFAEAKLQSLGFARDTNKSEIKDLARQAFGESEDSDLLSIEPEKLMKLSKSVKQSDRILAAKLLRKQINTKSIFILLELLRDVDPKVRYEALFTARKVKRQETWPILIEMLGSPSYGHHASAALKESGESVLPTLEAAFHKSGQSDLVMLRIVQIMGRIGGKYAQQLMWRKADYPDKRIVKQILYSFRYINYTAKGREVREVLNLLDAEISKAMWNIAAINELPADKHFDFLKEALQDEVADNYDQIFILLSILYDPQSVQLVRENLESGDPDNIAFAMELMDLFIDQELKHKLFPLLDEKPADEKLKLLQLHYPRENYTPVQVINYLLNRDFNLTNRWTKVCAIHAVAYMPEFRISRGLIAQVFNADRLLQETAAWVIYNKDRKAFESISDRLPPRDRKFLDSSIENNQLLEGLDDGFFLLIEMVMFVKQLRAFRNIHGSLICDLSDKITPIDLPAGDILKFDSEDHNSPIFIVAHGEIKLQDDDRLLKTMSKGDLYGDLFQNGPSEKANRLVAIERSIVFKINLMDFYFVMANHHELVQGLVKNVTGLSKKIRKTINPQPDGI